MSTVNRSSNSSRFAGCCFAASTCATKSSNRPCSMASRKVSLFMEHKIAQRRSSWKVEVPNGL
jgi:hypothetical protein